MKINHDKGIRKRFPVFETRLSEKQRAYYEAGFRQSVRDGTITLNGVKYKSA